MLRLTVYVRLRAGRIPVEKSLRVASCEQHPFADDIGIYVVSDGGAVNGCARLQAFLNELVLTVSNKNSVGALKSRR